MSNFEKAISKVLAHEGGYVDNKLDRGGETNFGISTRFLEKQIYGYGKVPTNYVRNLTIDDAKALYKTYFWDKISGDKIKSYPIAFAILDMSINKGPHVVINIVREIFNQATIPMTEAGAFMPDETLARLNELNTSDLQSDFIDKFVEIQKDNYNKIIAKYPEQEAFRYGWFKRLDSLSFYAKSNLSVFEIGGVEVSRQQTVGIGIGLIGMAFASIIGIRIIGERRRLKWYQFLKN